MTTIPEIVRAAVRAVPEVIEYLTPDALKAAQPEELPAITAEYHDRITQALISYFEGAAVTSPRNQWKQAMVGAFGAAFDMGWRDGGGEGKPDQDALAWFNPRVDAEMGYIDDAFATAKELRADPDADWFSWATARADGFTASVASVYNAAVMLAKKGQMLTWHLGATEHHCATCAKLDGQSHRASYYIAHDYIPRKPGAAMECGGFNCSCTLTDKEGNDVTISE